MKYHTSIAASGLWITVSEFVRNEILFKAYWTDHYASLGLSFQTLLINGILWTLWSFGLAACLYIIMKKIRTNEAIAAVWVLSFPMMWIVLYNLHVLPLPLLMYAVPLSLLEVWVAAKIIARYH